VLLEDKSGISLLLWPSCAIDCYLLFDCSFAYFCLTALRFSIQQFYCK